jgi:hypothetical protein
MWPPMTGEDDRTRGSRENPKMNRLTDGPVFLAADGQLDRHGAGRIVRTTALRARIGKAVTPHTLRHPFITAAPDAGVPLATSKRRRRTPTRGPRSGMTGPAAAWTAMPPTSSPPTSPAPPGNPRGPGTPPPDRRGQAAAHGRNPSRTAASNLRATRRCGGNSQLADMLSEPHPDGRSVAPVRARHSPPDRPICRRNGGCT